MSGLGGSFMNINNGVGGNDLRDYMTLSADKKTITIDVPSTTPPDLYTPLYVLMPGEVNFPWPTNIDWNTDCSGVAPSANLNLSTLQVNGADVFGFSSGTTDYNVILPFGTTAAPTVSATPAETNTNIVSVSITQATSVTGTATVTVSEVGTSNTKVYTLNFSVSTVDPSNNTECAGTSNDVFSGIPHFYSYRFETIPSGVNVTLTVSDPLVGLVGYILDYTIDPMVETGMTESANQTFTGLLAYTTAGEAITVRLKFAFAGGDAVTNDLVYHVGEDCAGTVGLVSAKTTSVYGYAANGAINIANLSSGDIISVYDTNGKLLKTITAQNSVESIAAGKGLSVVKVVTATGTTILKIMN